MYTSAFAPVTGAQPRSLWTRTQTSKSVLGVISDWAGVEYGSTGESFGTRKMSGLSQNACPAAFDGTAPLSVS